MRRGLLIIGACFALGIAGCASDSSTTPSTETTPSSSTEEATNPKEKEAAGKPKPVRRVKPKPQPKVTVPKGPPPKRLEVKDLEAGSGANVESGDAVTVSYVGINYKTGKEIDSYWDRPEPFTFTLGAGEVIPGWDQGLEGMKVGGMRELIVPPGLAYGSKGAPPAIPPNETLVFVVALEAME